MTILLLQMQMSEKLKPAQPQTQTLVLWCDILVSGAGQLGLGHEEAVDGSGKE